MKIREYLEKCRNNPNTYIVRHFCLDEPIEQGKSIRYKFNILLLANLLSATKYRSNNGQLSITQEGLCCLSLSDNELCKYIHKQVILQFPKYVQTILDKNLLQSLNAISITDFEYYPDYIHFFPLNTIRQNLNKSKLSKEFLQYLINNYPNRLNYIIHKTSKFYKPIK